MAVDELDGFTSIERGIAGQLKDPESFACLVDSLPDSTTKVGLQLWGASRGYYPRVPLPISAPAPSPTHTSARLASDQ